MTQLLVSVSSIEEAKVALDAGVDVIDLKHPGRGALGALASDEIKVIVGYVRAYDAHRRITATIGDLPMQPDMLSSAVEAMAANGVDVIKIGFFKAHTEPVATYDVCLNALRKFTQHGIKLVGVLFAEYDYPADMTTKLKNAGFYGVMIDTMNKNGTTFLDYHSDQETQRFVLNAKIHGLQLGLAGSLQLQHIPSVKRFEPDYIGFRSGLCDRNLRTNRLCPDRVMSAKTLL